MRVLKFGGSSLASVARFLDVATIVKSQLGQESIGLVLSAPQGVTNLLVELTELAPTTGNYQAVLERWQQRIQAILADAATHLDTQAQARLHAVYQDQYQALSSRLQGAALLRYCPDHIKAELHGLGEKFSVPLMTELLSTQAVKAAVA